jgi:hypothetical protein
MVITNFYVFGENDLRYVKKGTKFIEWWGLLWNR